MISINSEKRKGRSTNAQTSIDFLSGITIFLITLIFVLGFMTDTMAPVTTSTDETEVIADRASTLLVSSVTDDDGTLDSTDASGFFSQDTTEMKKSLGLDPGLYDYNITVNDTGTSDVNDEVFGNSTPDVASVSTRTRVIYADESVTVDDTDVEEGNTTVIEITVWRG
ncbi:MAG: hypothetical protein SV253_02205 [Halobacteria archaeon]|nr:hypothetical protein [Halobacteria archaeon]